MASATRDSVLSRYQLYKDGTKRIAVWLVQTATRHNNIGTIIAPFTASVFSADPPKSSAKNITLKTRDLLSLAEAIVTTCKTEAARAGTVTNAILELLDEVITFRSACADWYAVQAANAALAESNRSHRYFISILKEVYQLLAPIKAFEVSSSEKAKSKKGKTEPKKELDSRLSNLFSCLEIEEPSDAPLGTVPTQHRSSKAPISALDINLEDDDTETTFKLFCHLEDMKNARTLVKKSWEEYAQGKISLLAAGMVTDTAFSLSRLFDEEFVSSNPDFGDWFELVDFLSFDTMSHEKITCVFPKATGGNDTSARSTVDPTELLCPAAAWLLKGFGDKVRGLVNISHDGYKVGAVNSLFDFGSLLDIMDHQVGNWVKHMKSSKNQGFKDQKAIKSQDFPTGLAQYVATGVLPIWLVSACQMYCDVYQIIGSAPGCATRTYLTSVAELRRKSKAFVASNHDSGKICTEPQMLKNIWRLSDVTE